MPHWIRVRDTATRHEFDVDRRSLRAGLEPVNDARYPDLTGPGARPRPPRPFTGDSPDKKPSGRAAGRAN